MLLTRTVDSICYLLELEVKIAMSEWHFEGFLLGLCMISQSKLE